jgi:hypothetical protein
LYQSFLGKDKTEASASARRGVVIVLRSMVNTPAERELGGLKWP